MTYVELECGKDGCDNEIDNEVVYQDTTADKVIVTIICSECGSETTYTYGNPLVDSVIER